MSAGSDAARRGALAPGTLFAGRYRVERCLASGGMGAVYEVTHVETDRRRALKVMHAHLFDSDDIRDRFRREAKIAAQVESEHIVDVFDAGVEEATKTPFLVMELLKGEELGDRLKRVGPFPPEEVITYLEQAARALDKTHSRMIIHRDLKPANLFLSQTEGGQPRVKILDFGIAKVVEDGATRAGTTRSLGTPLYMAPEQFRAGSQLTPAADIHALGMVAYCLLTGEPYWAEEARTAGDVIAFVMTVVGGPKESAVKRAAARGVTLPPAFDAWFQRVTATSPQSRHRTASEAVQALAQALREPARAPGPPAQAASLAQTANPLQTATPAASPRLAASGTIVGVAGMWSPPASGPAAPAHPPQVSATSPGVGANMPVATSTGVGPFPVTGVTPGVGASVPVASSTGVGPFPVTGVTPGVGANMPVASSTGVGPFPVTGVTPGVAPNMPVAPGLAAASSMGVGPPAQVPATNPGVAPNMPVAPGVAAASSMGVGPLAAGLSGPQSVLERAASSTGGAMGDLRAAPPKSRAPLVAAISVAVALALVLGVIFVRRARHRAQQANQDVPAVVNPPPPDVSPAPPRTAAPPAETPTTEPASPPNSAGGPTSTSPKGPPKPTGQVPVKPTAKPTGVPTSLIGRD